MTRPKLRIGIIFLYFQDDQTIDDETEEVTFLIYYISDL